VGAITGLLVLLLVVAGNATGMIHIAWTWYVAIGTLVTFITGWAASLRPAPQPAG